MRNLHPADEVHKGFWTIPTSILQRKNGVCIYGRPACRVIFKDEEHIKSWLIRVTINQCLDYKKSLTKKNTVPIENVEIPFEQKEGEILKELQLLKEDERNVLYLYYYEGYKIKEIAKILKQKQNTINSKLTRARKKLKEIMEVEYE